MLQNITVKDVNKLILQSRLYAAGRGNGQSSTVNNFEIENVSTNITQSLFMWFCESH